MLDDEAEQRDAGVRVLHGRTDPLAPLRERAPEHVEPAGREIGERAGDLMPTYLGVAFGYYLICFPLARLATFVERRSYA